MVKKAINSIAVKNFSRCAPARTLFEVRTHACPAMGRPTQNEPAGKTRITLRPTRDHRVRLEGCSTASVYLPGHDALISPDRQQRLTNTATRQDQPKQSEQSTSNPLKSRPADSGRCSDKQEQLIEPGEWHGCKAIHVAKLLDQAPRLTDVSLYALMCKIGEERSRRSKPQSEKAECRHAEIARTRSIKPALAREKSWGHRKRNRRVGNPNIGVPVRSSTGRRNRKKIERKWMKPSKRKPST